MVEPPVGDTWASGTTTSRCWPQFWWPTATDCHKSGQVEGTILSDGNLALFDEFGFVVWSTNSHADAVYTSSSTTGDTMVAVLLNTSNLVLNPWSNPLPLCARASTTSVTLGSPAGSWGTTSAPVPHGEWSHRERTKTPPNRCTPFSSTRTGCHSSCCDGTTLGATRPPKTGHVNTFF